MFLCTSDAKPQYTTMRCNEYKNVQEIPLNKRVFIYEKCGMDEDRDINTSMNIYERGLQTLKRTAEDICEKPVESM